MCPAVSDCSFSSASDLTLFSFFSLQPRIQRLEGKASPYSIAERRVPELVPVLGSQPAGAKDKSQLHKILPFPFSPPFLFPSFPFVSFPLHSSPFLHFPSHFPFLLSHSPPFTPLPFPLPLRANQRRSSVLFCSAVLDPRVATPWSYFLHLSLSSVILIDVSVY